MLLFTKTTLVIWAVHKIMENIVLVCSSFFGLIFRKLRTMDSRSHKHINIGELTNNLTNDIFRIYVTFAMAFELITGPLHIILINVIMLFMFDTLIMSGILMLYFTCMVIVIIGTTIGRIVKKKMVINDERNKEVIFTLEGIRNVKLNNWENVVLGRINKLRKEEARMIWNIQFLQSFIDIVIFVMPTISGFICIAMFNYNGRALSLADSFFILTVFTLATGPLKNFFYALSSAVECLHSFKRIEFILDLPDTEQKEEEVENADLPKGGIRFQDFTASYQSTKFDSQILKTIRKFHGKNSAKYKDLALQIQLNGGIIENSKVNQNLNSSDATEETVNDSTTNDEFRLRGIDFQAKPGEITMIVGPIGGGKSSILKSVYGNLHEESGKILKNGSVAYMPQKSILVNATVKNNILFGRKEDEKRYQQAVKLSELKTDLDILIGGELTEVGSRGVNLSGGQKQRISIARAFYSDSDIYLIDDALSALDYNVSQKVFENLIRKNLLKNGKTVIMTTHLLQFLQFADNILFVENGIIKAQGSLEELNEKNEGFRIFIMNKEKDAKKKKDNTQEINESDEKELNLNEDNEESMALSVASNMKLRESSKQQLFSTLTISNLNSFLKFQIYIFVKSIEPPYFLNFQINSQNLISPISTTENSPKKKNSSEDDCKRESTANSSSSAAK